MSAQLSPSSSLPFPKLGVSLIQLEAFVSSTGSRQRSSFEGLTTTDVCETIVKPLTAASQSSYCDMLGSASKPAQVFISHAWKFKFLDVVDALLHHFRDSPDTIIWFDLFSNNQHKAVDLDFDWWCGTFKSAISEFQHVVMVLAPWSDPIPLTRAWCLFELYCSAVTKCRFEVAMTADQTQAFLEDIVDDTQSKINNMIGTINCEKSECYKPEDKVRIFEVVRKEVGFHKVNSIIFENLRTWVIETTSLAITLEINEQKRAKLKRVVSRSKQI